MAPASDTGPRPELERASRVVMASDQVSADLEGETVVLSLTEGVYYGLDRVGTHVWRQMRSPTSLGDLLESVLAAFDVDESRAWDDLVALMRDLIANGLVVRAEPDRG